MEDQPHPAQYDHQPAAPRTTWLVASPSSCYIAGCLILGALSMLLILSGGIILAIPLSGTTVEAREWAGFLAVPFLLVAIVLAIFAGTCGLVYIVMKNREDLFP